MSRKAIRLVPRLALPVLGRGRSSLRRHLPLSSVYVGSGGTTWFGGVVRLAPSIAKFFSGEDAHPGPSTRIWRRRIPRRIEEIAGAGGLPVLLLETPDSELAETLRSAIAVPSMVDLHTDLPADGDSLMAQLLTSTTREDFRRIRRAGFSYRITTEPDAIREFHARHYAPLVAQQFPDDGRLRSAESMLDQDGEVVCADIDGEWVAGIYNLRHADRYALGALGIRDADNGVRQKRVAAALIIRSLQRCVELGLDRATLGRSLPFLGKGPVWFKAKWGGIVTRKPDTPDIHMFIDLRHAAVRRMLSESPIIHTEGNTLVVSTWLEPGDKPLQATVRDAGRFPGIARWYVLADPETLASGEAQLSAGQRIVTVPVTPDGDRPVWLAEALAAR